ncbi:MAG: four helix bundle protein [Gammaproteobacteria bacterium]|nr:MAG: four helix bundle protein [Gammaproteobacteria bacterium]
MARMPARRFQDLDVWKKAHEWVLMVYRFSERFPAHERYGLTAQLRRAAISVPANIAEGFSKRSYLDKARYYNIAQGSLEECRYYLILSRDLGYGDDREISRMLDDLSRILGSYAATVYKNRHANDSKNSQ